MKKYLDINKILRISCLLCAVSAMFKMVILINAPFSYDELFTVVATDPRYSFFYLAKKYLLIDVHPPLHYLFTYAVNMFFPVQTEISMRFHSLIFCWLTVIISFFCFPKYLPKNAKYIFTALTASSFFAVFYAVDARPYAMLLFLSTALTLIMLSFIHKINGKKTITNNWFTLYFVVTLCLTYTHYWGSLFAGAVFLAMLFYSRKNHEYIKKFIIFYIVVLVLFLPWLIPNVYLNIMQKRFAGNWWAGTMNLPYFMTDLQKHLFVKEYGIYFFTALLSFCVYFLLKYKNKYAALKYKAEFAAPLAIIFFVAAFTVLISLKINLLHVRYFTVIAPCLFFVIALLCAANIKHHKLAWLPVLFLLSLYTLSLDKDKLTSASRSISSIIASMPKEEQKILVIDFYPNNSLEKMYSYYANDRFGRNIKFTEIMTNPQTEINNDDIIWLPHCQRFKLEVAETELKVPFKIVSRIGESCFIQKEAGRRYMNYGHIYKHDPGAGLKWEK
ncbi:hypothetical protein Dip510_000160 [Elusimicrobium posterum]|uniref:glycosyltransferase family 39 protein n=1 Tax=Elusimicrobium posterum TaxID=3116653 RepID=UPI003C792ECE